MYRLLSFITTRLLGAFGVLRTPVTLYAETNLLITSILHLSKRQTLVPIFGAVYAIAGFSKGLITFCNRFKNALRSGYGYDILPSYCGEQRVG